ncbi:MAG: outer rane receptor for ferrienterochelin and colicin [Rhodocyclaceae bacterium]|nr:outer rane receptor for ferrienterochelin and colicin [Rhodocyclaceae bacterium]
MKFAFGLVAGLLYSLTVFAETGSPPDSLASQSLEDLLDTEVSSVLKHASGLADAPAAVTVLRREDIERLGATTLPDLLRVVPGLAVAQIDGNKWAIGARGFNGFFGSKLLVLIDGRSIYNSTFAGVFWDAYDIPFDNIARIEVIRGPAGVLWGSNAVNGVINIVTRSAQETVGGRAAVAAGNVERHLADLRYGAETDSAAWRLYARSRDRDEQKAATATSPGDTTRAERVGFRADSNHSGATAWMLTGDAYQGRSGGAPYPQPTTDDIRGEHLLGRLTERLSSGSTLQFQAYYDHAWRKDLAVGSVLDEHVFDLDLQHDVQVSPSHRLTWGTGWRQYQFDSTGSAKLAFVPPSRTTAVSNLFLQDEWSLLPRELVVIAGLRGERLPDHGVQWQPNVRAAWTPTSRHTFWAASGKAVRAPNKIDTDIRYCGPLGTNLACTPPAGANPLLAAGNPDFRPEKVVSLEAGWRTRLSHHLSSDLAIYRNRYRDLETIEFSQFSPTDIHLTYFNHAKGTTEGLEWALDWQAADNWQLRGGLTLYRESLSFSETPAFPNAIISFHDSFPNRQAFLRSLWDFAPGQRFDLTLRGVGPLAHRGVSGYGTADFRWSWRYDKRLEFSLIGRNLGGPRHREIADQPFFQETLLRREVVGAVAVSF